MQVNNGLRTIIYPVKDIGQAKQVFGALLGVEPYVDESYYAGFRLGGHEVGLDPNGHKHGVTPYWEISAIESTLKRLVDAGAEIVQEAKDVGGGMLTAVVRDGDGNIIGLRQSP
jgi:predicted enzyme related to lactoylglutathione lyase